MIAALGNFQVGVVARREFDALRRDQIDQRIVRRWLRRQVFVHGLHDGFVLRGAGDRQHLRVHVPDALRVGAGAHAAGDDDLAVLLEGLADRVQRFLFGAVDETAGVHHHHIGIFVAGHDVVALQPQLGEDALGVDQGLRTAKANEPDLGRGGGGAGHK